MPTLPAALILLIAAFVLPSTAAARGACSAPYAVVVEQRSYNDPDRGNRSVPLRLHRPAAGAGGPLPPGCGFGLVAFGHGFTIANTAYDFLANALAAAGYVVLLPATESGFSPSHQAFGLDLAFALRAVGADPGNTSALGPLRVVGGHSMGGGAALLAAASDPSIGALFALAPAETQPSAIAAASTVSVPARMILGSRDCVTPRAQHGQPIFDALATPVAAKTIDEIAGASHCQFSNGSLTCSIGEGSCGGAATISAAQQHGETLQLLLPWLLTLGSQTPELLADGFESSTR